MAGEKRIVELRARIRAERERREQELIDAINGIKEQIRLINEKLEKGRL